MFNVIGYALAVAAALSIVGFCAERLAALRGMARRHFWLLAMVVSIAWPLAMITRERPAAAVSVPVAETVNAAPPILTQTPVIENARQSMPDVQLVTSREWVSEAQAWLVPVWRGASGMFALYLLVMGALLRRRAARWRRENVLGRALFVSDSTGPALLGALSPRIVVPRWFLEESADVQALILAHEEQHIAARDPLLLRVAQLLVVAAPWNLPLWWQLHRLRHAIEMDCDARVLRAGAEAAAYGEVLLTVARRAGRVPVGAVAMSEPVSALEQRVRNLLPRPMRLVMVRTIAALAFAAAAVGAAVALEAPTLPALTAQQLAAQARDVRQAQEQGQQQTQRQAQQQAQQQVQQESQLLEQRARQQQIESATQREQEARMAADQQRRQQKVVAEQVAAQQAAVKAQAASAAAEAKDGTDLFDLVRLAATRFKKIFVVDPRVRGRVDPAMFAPDSLSYHAFLETLGVHGFVAVPSGDVVTIIPENFARTVASPIVRADDIKGDDAEIVTVLIPIEGDVGRMFSTIQHLIPQWAVVELTSQQQILLVDRVANARRIVALVRAQSKPQ